MLNLRGLPETIVEAVAQHHRPTPEHGAGMTAVMAVHVACPLADGEAWQLDVEHLERAGFSDRLPSWREIAAEEADR